MTGPQLQVELDMMSGLSNPVLQLTAGEARELLRRMEGLASCGPPPSPPGLGYRGFEILNPESWGGLPRRMRIYQGVVTAHGENFVEHLRDEKDVESWLGALAATRGYQAPALAE